jgi:archaemetzincin
VSRLWASAVLLLAVALTPAACHRVDGNSETGQARSSDVTPKEKAPRAAHFAVGPLDELPPGWRRLFSDDSRFEPLPQPSPGDWLAEHPEPGQTFEQFVADSPNRPDQARKFIYLQPIGAFDSRSSPDVAVLRDYAERFFSVPTRLLPALSSQGMAITERRNPLFGNRQLLTTDILDELQRRLPDDAYCLLGISMQDLYPADSWNFVFGQARLRDRVGVYSLARYDPAFCDEPPAQDVRRLVLRRSLKVMVHEIAHMFGLEHCIFYHCFLNGSNHLAESDARPLHACPVCLRKLQWSTGFNPLDRYTRLRDFYLKHGFQDEAAWLEARLRSATAAP